MVKLIVCPHCEDGYTTCLVCQGGRGMLTCPECDGDGSWYDPDAEKLRECNRCEGEGIVDAQDCGHCGGQGSVLCVPCHGTGRLSEDDCITCGGSEEIICRRCSGSGEGRDDNEGACARCEGSGKRSCPACM